jgi:hypothetical protein
MFLNNDFSNLQLYKAIILAKTGLYEVDAILITIMEKNTGLYGVRLLVSTILLIMVQKAAACTLLVGE